MSMIGSGERQKASFLPKRAIGSFTATITIEEVGIDEMEITAHPVQQGAEITDHAYKKPAELSVHVMWSDEDAPLHETYQNLLDLQETREPFDVITGKRQYKNMLISSLRMTTDKNTENVLDIGLSLREINIVSVETVSVADSTSGYSPERSKQENPGKTDATRKAGKKSAQDTKQQEGAGSTESTRRRSALATIWGRGG